MRLRAFVAGLLAGMLLTGSAAAYVVGPQMVGTDGYLIGWDIIIKTPGGEKLKCRDPYVWLGTSEMECKLR